MKTAFEVDGVVMDGDEQCLQLAIAPQILIRVGDYLRKAPANSQNLDCKQHKAFRALGFALLNAAGCLLGDMRPEDFGFETVLDDDEADSRAA